MLVQQLRDGVGALHVGHLHFDACKAALRCGRIPGAQGRTLSARAPLVSKRERHRDSRPPASVNIIDRFAATFMARRMRRPPPPLLHARNDPRAETMRAGNVAPPGGSNSTCAAYAFELARMQTIITLESHLHGHRYSKTGDVSQ